MLQDEAANVTRNNYNQETATGKQTQVRCFPTETAEAAEGSGLSHTHLPKQRELAWSHRRAPGSRPAAIPESHKLADFNNVSLHSLDAARQGQGAVRVFLQGPYLGWKTATC